MKALWLIVGLAILVGVVFFLQDTKAPEHMDDDDHMEEVHDDGDEHMNDGETMGMPADGNTDVDEMIVNDMGDEEMMDGDKGGDSSGAAGTRPEGTEGDWTDTPTEGGNGLETSASSDKVNAEGGEGDLGQEVMGSVKEFTVDSFSFGYSMDTIKVSEGDTVTINLTNSGGFHDWVVDEFDAATEKIAEGGETSVTFVADKAGKY